MYFEIICMGIHRRLPWLYIHPCHAVRICVYYFNSLFLLWPDLTSTEQFTNCLNLILTLVIYLLLGLYWYDCTAEKGESCDIYIFSC